MCQDASEIEDAVVYDHRWIQKGQAGAEVQSGCSDSAKFVFQYAPDLWLCAPDNQASNNVFSHHYDACNEEKGFHMTTVRVMTKRGAPTDAKIDAGSKWAQGKGFDYIV